MTPVGTIASTARARTRRWELTTSDAVTAARCASYLDGLERLSYDDWLALGRRAAMRAPAADDALDAAIAARQLGVTAWLVRDAVHTIAHAARGAHAPCATWAAARDAAARAALATLAPA